LSISKQTTSDVSGGEDLVKVPTSDLCCEDSIEGEKAMSVGHVRLEPFPAIPSQRGFRFEI
jgi:hypothetical protein